ncbi:putative invertase inhibitor [Elaeis guineensis]|uniref:Invertase inhibitor n=1 Tax=Elaeis guineensis var. tenera TaxID=51953 RepID=A0A6I9Q9P5_ELAGV|nr:putative invertase inhibitor [Elaeis guineensis]
MAAFTALLCFILILNQSSCLVNASVTETCKKAAASGAKFIYDFCVATLSAAPGSSTADTQGLAIIAANLTTANATSTELTISILLKKTKDNATQQCLRTCSTIYSFMVDRLNYISSAITSKHYSDARIYLSSVMGIVRECEAQFGDMHIKSPLTKENDDSLKLSILTLDLVDLLK